MSRTLTFYGASDDLFEIEGSKKGEPDEIGCYGKPVSVAVIDPGTDGDPDTGLQVVAIYATGFENAVWSIGIAQLDEDMALPSWPMKWSHEGYSVRLTTEVPDTVVIRETKDT